MRTYTIDELEKADVEKINKHLKKLGIQSSIEGMFWLPIPLALHTELQKEHLDSCGAYCLALEVAEEALHLEFLVRAKGKLRCECMGFANQSLREHMVNYLDNMLLELGIVF